MASEIEDVTLLDNEATHWAAHRVKKGEVVLSAAEAEASEEADGREAVGWGEPVTVIVLGVGPDPGQRV